MFGIQLSKLKGEAMEKLRTNLSTAKNELRYFVKVGDDSTHVNHPTVYGGVGKSINGDVAAKIAELTTKGLVFFVFSIFRDNKSYSSLMILEFGNFFLE